VSFLVAPSIVHNMPMGTKDILRTLSVVLFEMSYPIFDYLQIWNLDAYAAIVEDKIEIDAFSQV
jgi:hypothetical protein